MFFVALLGGMVVSGRKVQTERGADARFAVDVDRALVLAHDSVDHGQAEPAAFAHLLGREERLEDVRLDIAGDSAAGVGDAEDDVRSRREFELAGPRRPRSRTMRSVLSTKVPPDGMASRALRHKFNSAC